MTSLTKIEILVRYAHSLKITEYDDKYRVEADGWGASTAETAEQAAGMVIDRILAAARNDLAGAERQVETKKTKLQGVLKLLGLEA